MATALVLALGQPFLAGWGRGGRAAELQIPGRERPKQGVGDGEKHRTQPGGNIAFNPQRKETRCSEMLDVQSPTQIHLGPSPPRHVPQPLGLSACGWDGVSAPL